MLSLAAALLGGVCAVHLLPVLPASRWLAVPIMVCVVAAALRRRRGMTVVLCAAMGVTWAWTHGAMRLADALPPGTVQVDADVVGYVASTLGGDAQGVRFAFDVVESEPRVPSRIELTWYDSAVRPAPGEQWRLRVRVRPPRGFANPGGSDYAATLWRKAVGATGYVRDGARDGDGNRRLAAADWRYAVLRVRADISNRIERALPDSPHVGIVQGLTVGDTHRIDSRQWRVFAATGTTHLMAISGLHVGMVAALAAWLGGALARRLRLQARRIAVVDVQSLCGMSAAVCYAALAGFSVPTQRALVMLLVYFGARVSRRQISVTHGFGLALCGVLLIDPFAPLSPGFWLSFGAVAAIFLATTGRLAQPHWIANYAQLQAAVSIGLMPFLIGAFGAVSLISPLVNLAAIPFYTFLVVPIALLGSFLLPVSDGLGGAILQLGALLLEWSWPVLQWAADLSLAMWYLPKLPLWAAALLSLGCALSIAPGMSATRLAGAMLCLPALTWQPAHPQAGEFEFAVLDVGQGLAAVVMTRSHALVYDAGPSFRSGRDTGEMVVLPYLRSRGVRRIDTLVVSHGDDDHAGGARSVLAAMPVTRVLAGPSVKLAHPVIPCGRGQTWRWDEVTFTVLHPEAGDAWRRNDSSCVVRIDGRFGSVMLLGDIEREAEAQLTASGPMRPADIVVMPHHGSRTSSTLELVGALRPRIAVASAGYGNRWGFPKDDVVARWREVGARTMSTADSGAIEFSITSDSDVTVREYRAMHRAYWRP